MPEKTRAALLKAHLGKPRSEETKAKQRKAWTPEKRREHGANMSRIRVEQMLSGTVSLGNARHYHRGWIETQKGGRIFVRSSWERDYAKRLDEDPSVTSFRYEAYKIPYIFEGFRHTALIDFRVEFTDGSNMLVEVKPPPLVGRKERVRFLTIACFAEKLGWSFRWWNGKEHVAVEKRHGVPQARSHRRGTSFSKSEATKLGKKGGEQSEYVHKATTFGASGGFRLSRA